MNIIEAIKSGKPFKRKTVEGGYYQPNPNKSMLLLESDILADDWIVAEANVTITESDFQRISDTVMCRFMINNSNNVELTCRDYFLLLKSELFGTRYKLHDPR